MDSIQYDSNYEDRYYKKSASNIVLVAMDLFRLVFAGVYSVVIYIILVNGISIQNRLESLGVKNKWIAFVGLLFAFGYIKHKIGYYTLIHSAYCKQTDVCAQLLHRPNLSLVEKLKSFLGMEGNIWFEAVGEGIMFVIVGVPLFLFVRPQLLAAFATGIIAHLTAENTGLNKYFCRTSCGLNPVNITAAMNYAK